MLIHTARGPYQLTPDPRCPGLQEIAIIATVAAPFDRPLIGISSCLLGAPVRYDGGHKRDDFLTDVLAAHVEFRPFCPEVGAGLGVPRPSIRMANVDGAIRLLDNTDAARDVTDAIVRYADSVRPQQHALSGYVLKSKSPSCGMARVKVHGAAGGMPQHTSGRYAERLLAQFPLLPIEEEGRLNDPELRENFVTRVYAYARWQAFRAGTVSKAALIDFHTRHKLLLLAHSEAAYRRLGRLVAEQKAPLTAAWLDGYAEDFMTALRRRPTRKRHANVLQHIAGYFKRELDADDRAELAESIDAYRLGHVPLVVPLTLLEHHLRRHPDPYLESQLYFEPWPRVLGLRNVL